MPVSLITGVTGQDGYYLARLLAREGHEVWSATRTGEVPTDLRFVRPTPPFDLTDGASVDRAIAAASPDEVYHLAAQSSVARSWEDPLRTAEVTGLGAGRVIDAIWRLRPTARVFLASSSEVFGEPDAAPQDESTPIRPTSPYGAAKAFAHHLAAAYRRRGLFVAAGILYNHESPRRSPEFVTGKIVRGAVAIARGEQRELRLGNLEARRDWGYAGDYVRAMRLMLRADAPADYVVATGEARSVGEFCVAAFARVGLDAPAHVVSDPAFWRPAAGAPLVGNAAKIRDALGWTPTHSFAQVVNLMVDAELARVEGRGGGRAGGLAAAGRDT